ncbi:MAG: sigma-70 family RNA polymerase sigma factor [Hyphomicrobiaceae bacterium]
MGIIGKSFDHYFVHRRELVDYATAIVGDRARGEDVVQEAFLRFGTATIDRTIEEPIGYLRKIVRNLALDWVRRLSLERACFDSEFPAETIAEDRPNPEQALSARDELRLVMAAMAELPDRTRTALELHRFHGWKLKDIAAHLDISVGRAHSLVYDGLEHCRKRLAGGA